MGLNFLETNYFHQHLEDSSGKKLAFEGNDDYRGNSKEKLHAMELHQDYMSAVINGSKRNLSCSGDNLLQTLYCLILSKPVNSISALQRKQVGTVEGSYIDALSASLRMMPLSVICMKSLFRRYIMREVNISPWQELIQSQSASDEPANDHSTSTNSIPFHEPCAFHLIPDHCRYRLQQSSLSSSLSAQSRGDGHQVPKGDRSKLRHTYVLMSDEDHFVATDSTKQTRGNNKTKRDSAQNGVETKSSQCLYLVQLWYECTTEENGSKIGRQSRERQRIGNEKIELDSLGSKLDDLDIGLHRSRDGSHRQSRTLSRSSGVEYDARCEEAMHLNDYKLQETILRKILIGEIQAFSKHQTTDMTGMDEEEQADYINNSKAENNIQEKGSRRKWDHTILSSVCRWRACMAEADFTGLKSRNDSYSFSFLDEQSQGSYVCRYHAELKKFLDKPPTYGSKKSSENLIPESSKYLPRKAPTFAAAHGLSEDKKDLLTIRAASTLLQELWDGKLKATVKAFTKKVTRDISYRNFLESSVLIHKKTQKEAQFEKDAFHVLQLRQLPDPPNWAMWKNKEQFERYKSYL